MTSPDVPAGVPPEDESVDVTADDAAGNDRPASMDPDSYVDGGESLGGTAGVGGAG